MFLRSIVLGIVILFILNACGGGGGGGGGDVIAPAARITFPPLFQRPKATASLCGVRLPIPVRLPWYG